MLAHRSARAGDDERGDSRHVDRMTPIAASTNDVHHAVTQPSLKRYRHCCVKHCVKQTRNLGSALSLASQRNDKPRDLCGSGLAGQNACHGRLAPTGTQVLALQ